MPFRRVCYSSGIVGLICYLVHFKDPNFYSLNRIDTFDDDEIRIGPDVIVYPDSVERQRNFQPDWDRYLMAVMRKPPIRKTPPTTTTIKPTISCPINEAYDIYDGKCYRLTAQGPCKRDEWWILDAFDTPTCQKRPCKQFYAQSPDGECVLMVTVDKINLCKPGNRYYHDNFGIPKCDCRSNHYIWSDGACYSGYAQGPCKAGHYIRFNNTKGEAECQPNPCREDGLVLWDGQCVQNGALCDEIGDKNLFINPHTGELGCYDFFRVPQEPPENGCQIGTKASRQGKC